MIISFWVPKGGTGKTTLSCALAQNKSLPFRNRLLVNLDPQTWLGSGMAGLAPVPAEWRGTTDLLLAFAKADECGSLGQSLVTLEDGTLYLRPDRSLENVGRLWPQRGGRRRPEQALKALLDYMEVTGDDETLCVIDCPPGSARSFLPRMALAASEAVILPTTPEPLAVDGVVSAVSDLELVKEGSAEERPLNPNLKVLGVVLNRISGRIGKVDKEVAGKLPDLLDRLGVPLFDTAVREKTAFHQAQLEGRSIFESAGKGPAVEDALAFGEEVIRRMIR